MVVTSPVVSLVQEHKNTPIKMKRKMTIFLLIIPTYPLQKSDLDENHNRDEFVFNRFEHYDKKCLSYDNILTSIYQVICPAKGWES
jgi:hypothetical protein